MFKIQFPSGFLLAIMFITFTIFSCQKEEFGEVIPLEEQTFENLSATLKSDNDCKDKVKSIQREFEKNFYSDKMSKEVFQANFGMIDWSSNGADCDLVDPEFFSIFPLRSIVNKKDLQSLLVITQTGEKAEENFWIFSTLTAPSAISSGQSPFALSWPDGFHPVSGNRQFGYFTNSAGNMEIYTRGVDRFFPLTQNEDSWAGYLVGYLVENTAFGGADDLWESLQERITSFVNNSPQNGIANIIDPVKLRPPTGDALLTLLKQSEPITSIPCQ